MRQISDRRKLAALAARDPALCPRAGTDGCSSIDILCAALGAPQLAPCVAQGVTPYLIAMEP